MRRILKTEKSSDDGEEVTPVPIPNTEVKLFSADGSWGSPPVRVGRRWAPKKSRYRVIGNDFFVMSKWLVKGYTNNFMGYNTLFMGYRVIYM